MELDAELEIRELLASGPSSLRPLRSRVPRTTLYEALGRLRAQGTVVPGERAGTWRLLMAGAVAPPSSPTPPPIVWPTLPGAQAHLDVLPSREHQALGRLILLAATARRHYEHHHASFVLYSASGLRGKTWLGRWASLVLGGGEVVHAVAEGGRSLGARRRGDGQVAAVRSALAGPALMIDEWRRGSSDVRRITTLLIHGDRVIPLESESILVSAVVLLAMNSPQDATSVEDATGLDAAMIRRCLAACLEFVKLDPAFARDGEDRLDRVRGLGPVVLQEIRAGVVDERSLRDRIADALESVLDSPERMGSLDLVLLGQLAVAAVAWGLSLDDAVAMVVHACCVLWATTAWTAPDWEAALAELVMGDGDCVEEPVTEVIEESMDLELEFDYESRLVAVDRAMRDAVVELEDLPGLLRDGAALRSLGLDAAHAPGVAEVLRLVRGPDGRAVDRLHVLVALDQHGLDPAQVERALAALAAGRDGLGLEVEDVASMVRGVEDAGLAPEEVGAWLVDVLRELKRIDGAIVEARAELREWRRRTREAAGDYWTIHGRVHALARVLERAEREPALAEAIGLAEAERGREVVAEVLEIADQLLTERAREEPVAATRVGPGV